MIRVAESTLTALAYYHLGLFAAPSLRLLPWIVPVVAVGVPLGTVLIRRLDAEVFRRICMSFDAWIVGFGLSKVLVSVGLVVGLGGTEGQFVELASRLDRSMWDVHVSCIRAEGPLRARLEAAGVRAWSCGRGSLKSLGALARVWRLTRYLRHARIDLVHTFDFYSNVVGGVAARLAGIRAVIASQRD